jgi:hypothetical protein
VAGTQQTFSAIGKLADRTAVAIGVTWIATGRSIDAQVQSGLPRNCSVADPLRRATRRHRRAAAASGASSSAIGRRIHDGALDAAETWDEEDRMGETTKHNDSGGRRRRQDIVIEQLVAGKSTAAAAEAAGIDRTTVYRWHRKDYEFRARLNRRRVDLQDEIALRLTAFASRAAENLGRAIDNGDLKASLTALKAIGALDRARCSEADANAKLLRTRQGLAAKQAECSRGLAELGLE